MIPAPNILVTNYCNQNCPFCFAREEMSRDAPNRDMRVEDFGTVIRKIKRTGATSVRLLGGEPTIHARFQDLIRLSLANFRTVQLFTNGIFPEDHARFLNQYGDRIRYVFNVVTPGFILQKKVRDLVLERISGLPPAAHVAFSLTVDPFMDIDAYLGLLPDALFKRVSVIRVGLSNPMKGSRNTYAVKDYPRIGSLLVRMRKRMTAKNKALQFAYGCGLTRCMFTEKELSYLRQGNPELLRFGCHGKKSPMDITTDLRAFHCFPLSNERTVSIRDTSLAKAHRTLLVRRLAHWQKTQMEMCRRCPFFGVGEGKCPGPCIAFRLNQIRYESS